MTHRISTYAALAAVVVTLALTTSCAAKDDAPAGDPHSEHSEGSGSRSLVGAQRATCGTSGCRDARFRRLHPKAYAERERRKVERGRARRREARGS